MATDDAPDPAPRGSRLEVAILLARAVVDVACWPFQLVGFLATRRAVRRRFAAALIECSPLPDTAETEPDGPAPDGGSS